MLARRRRGGVGRNRGEAATCQGPTYVKVCAAPHAGHQRTTTGKGEGAPSGSLPFFSKSKASG